MFAFSEQSWVDAACRMRLASVVPSLERLLSPYGLRVIFLGGSAALGEAVGWEGEAPFVLSDLDLGVVTELPFPNEVVTEIGALETPDEHGLEVHVGCYLAAHQHLQEPTLGLWDTVMAGRVLAGDARWLQRFRASLPARPSAWEAYRIIGNRSLELLHAPSPRGGEAAHVRSRFALGKLATALWTAQLVLEGRYVVGRRARRKLLESVPAGSSARSAPLAWAAFLDGPGPGTIPAGQSELTLVRRGLVGFFEENGYWADAPNPTGPEDAFLAPRVRVRAWARAWRSEGRILVRRGAWKTSFRGTPESRRQGLAALYWACLPEQPEPDWGADSIGSHAERWERGSQRLTGQPLPSGAGCRERSVSWVRESSGSRR